MNYQSFYKKGYSARFFVPLEVSVLVPASVGVCTYQMVNIFEIMYKNSTDYDFYAKLERSDGCCLESVYVSYIKTIYVITSDKIECLSLHQLFDSKYLNFDKYKKMEV